MRDSKFLRRAVPLLATLLALPLAVTHAASPQQTLPEAREASAQAPAPGVAMLEAAARSPEAKIEGILAEKVAQARPADSLYVIVTSATPLDAGNLATVLHRWSWPA